MQDWTKVVVQPLGLAGFALFLVFGLIARIKRNDDRRWLSKIAAAMAGVALVGGLALAYVNVRNSAVPAPLQVQSIQTTGAASPVIVNSGSVTYTATTPLPATSNTTSSATNASGGAPAPKAGAPAKPTDKKP